MNITSTWEFRCFYFPDAALKEFKDSLTSSGLAVFLLAESLNEIKRKNK